MQLECRYEEPHNTVAGLQVTHLVKGVWEDFELGFAQPGFLIFVYAILNCQHLYMRTNADERGLVLASATGAIDVLTDQDWVLRKLHVRFEAELRSGMPSPGDVDYIVDRMQHCPVSVNLREVADTTTRVELIPAR
jgi:hypothetical protein